MYREDFINALRQELLELVEKYISPIAKRYGYSDIPLETNIRWRPLVLVLGNYSSGKSALINEFIGATIQTTGQAPTDDSFTILTYGDAPAGTPDGEIQVTEERDGKFLINDSEYPFQKLKRHGQRFSAHFRLKKINSPILENFAIIDTPGMLDSITEQDRGYNYQEVIGDLAQIADLILVLFDAHKAGTVRETHISLRDTLPAYTFEDRVLFVLNRIDECATLKDLLRVYGTLCWNLSQITGRKDIPLINLTYSPSAAADAGTLKKPEMGYLEYLENQRQDLKKAVLEAPKRRLDNIATFVEMHSERLAHFLEALANYAVRRRSFYIKQFFMGILPSLAGSAAIMALLLNFGLIAWMPPPIMLGVGGSIAACILFLWLTVCSPMLANRFHLKQLENLDDLTSLDNQSRKDNWEAVRDVTRKYLEKTDGKYSLFYVEDDYATVSKVMKQGSKEIRDAISEIAAIPPGEKVDNPPGPFLSALAREMQLWEPFFNY